MNRNFEGGFGGSGEAQRSVRLSKIERGERNSGSALLKYAKSRKSRKISKNTAISQQFLEKVASGSGVAGFRRHDFERRKYKICKMP